MPNAILSSRARRDLLSAVDWIAKDNRAAANGLHHAVMLATKRIGEHPRIGVVRADLTTEPLRFVYLAGYPHVIVYDPELSPPVILRILHGARDIPSILGHP